MKKWIVFVGMFALMIAAPCWGAGMEDFQSAELCFDAGSHDDALGFYQKAISSGELPDNEMAIARYTSAVILFLKLELDQSMSEINRLIEKAPDHIAAYGLRATLWVEMEKANGKDVGKNALPDWERALSLDPNDAFTFNDRGRYFAEKGQLKKAISDLERYIDLVPADCEGQQSLLKKLKSELGDQKCDAP